MLVDGDFGHLEKLGNLLQRGRDALLGNVVFYKIDNVKLLLRIKQILCPDFRCREEP